MIEQNDQDWMKKIQRLSRGPPKIFLAPYSSEATQWFSTFTICFIIFRAPYRSINRQMDSFTNEEIHKARIEKTSK